MKQKWWVSMHLSDYCGPWYNRGTEKLEPHTINNKKKQKSYFFSEEIKGLN